jgi:hypothetical protein
MRASGTGCASRCSFSASRPATCGRRGAAIVALLATTEDDDVHLMLALETALVVCYARPFTHGKRVGQLGEEWAPEDAHERAVHDELLVLRNQAYAHTDKASGRDVIERFEL